MCGEGRLKWKTTPEGDKENGFAKKVSLPVQGKEASISVRLLMSKYESVD